MLTEVLVHRKPDTRDTWANMIYQIRRSFKRQQSGSHKLAELDCWRTATIFDMLEFELLESVVKSVHEVHIQKGDVRTARSSHGSRRRL